MNYTRVTLEELRNERFEQRMRERLQKKQEGLREKRRFLEECLDAFQINSEVELVTKGLLENFLFKDQESRAVPQMAIQLTKLVSSETNVSWEEWSAILEEVYRRVERPFKEDLFRDVFKH